MSFYGDQVVSEAAEAELTSETSCRGLGETKQSQDTGQGIPDTEAQQVLTHRGLLLNECVRMQESSEL